MSRWTAAAALSFALALGLAIRVAAQSARTEPVSADPLAVALPPADLPCTALEQSSDVGVLWNAAHADRSPVTRRCATGRLGDLDSDAAVERLRELADDPDETIADAALGALARHESTSARAFVTERAKTSVSALVAMAQAHAPDAAARILEALASTQATRQKARLIAALGEAGDESAVVPLTALLADGEMRRTVISALGRIGGPKARPVLDRVLADAPDRDLGTVIAAMDGYADGEALMVRALCSRRQALRAAAAEALRDRDTPAVRELMRQALEGADPERLEMALSYDADAVDPSAIPSLARLARDPRPAIADAAVTALVAQGPNAHASLAALVREGHERSTRVLSAARETLALRPALREAALRRLREGSARDGSVLDYLANDLSHESLDALVAAARIARHPEPLVQAVAARGDAASLEALGRLATDADAALSRASVQTLASHADARAKGALVRASASSDASVRREAISTLLRIGAPEGTRALDGLAASADAGDREQAVAWLVAYGPPRPEPRLETLATDHDPSVATAALLQLMEIDEARARAIARQRKEENPDDHAASVVLTRHRRRKW